MTGTSHQQSRILLVDVARVLAIMSMIQGHALDVLLAPACREGILFNLWLFVRGLTAPMFLLLSGFSFTISTLRHWDSHQSLSKASLRRLGRFASFVMLAYAMHLPVRSLQELRRLDSAGWQSWLQVDVLQCVGVTLVLLQVLVVISGNPETFAKMALASSAFIVLMAPVAGRIEWSGHLPLSLASYLNTRTGSIFPLFPWSGYVLFGAAIGYAYMRWRSESLPTRLLPVAGAVLVVSGFCLNSMPVNFYGGADFWKTSPNLFFIRAGFICLLLAVIGKFTTRIPIPQQLTRSVAQESLTVYLVHCCILYGSILNPGLRQRVGATLGFLPTLAWIALLLLSMTLLALAWNRLKSRTPKACRLVPFAVALAVAYSCI